LDGESTVTAKSYIDTEAVQQNKNKLQLINQQTVKHQHKGSSDY